MLKIFLAETECEGGMLLWLDMAWCALCVGALEREPEPAWGPQEVKPGGGLLGALSEALV